MQQLEASEARRRREKKKERVLVHSGASECGDPHLPLVQPLDGGVGSVGVAGLHRVVGADAQGRAGVAARAVGHHDHARTLAARDASEELLGELAGRRRAGCFKGAESIRGQPVCNTLLKTQALGWVLVVS